MTFPFALGSFMKNSCKEYGVWWKKIEGIASTFYMSENESEWNSFFFFPWARRALTSNKRWYTCGILVGSLLVAMFHRDLPPADLGSYRSLWALSFALMRPSRLRSPQLVHPCINSVTMIEGKISLQAAAVIALRSTSTRQQVMIGRPLPSSRPY